MGGINDIVLSHDHSMVLSVGQERRVTIWDLRMPQALRYVEFGSEAHSVAVSNNGRFFAAAGDSGVVKVYDFATSKELGTLLHTAKKYHVAPWYGL